jgi:hypothetical protein
VTLEQKGPTRDHWGYVNTPVYACFSRGPRSKCPHLHPDASDVGAAIVLCERKRQPRRVGIVTCRETGGVEPGCLPLADQPAAYLTGLIHEYELAP